MPIEDRDYVRGEHPPACTCTECTEKRLGKYSKESKPRKSLKLGMTKTPPSKNMGYSKKEFPPTLMPIILIFSCILVGFGISLFIGTSMPLWVLLTFSTIYSIEKWGKKATVNKAIGIPYKLFLNVLVLSVLGYIIWFGIKLFTQSLPFSPIRSSLLFIGELVFFIWLCRVLAKNSWRLPSMKLTVFSLLAIAIVFAFAGVEPISSYKDNLFNSISSYLEEQQTIREAEEKAAEEAKMKAEKVAEEERIQAEVLAKAESERQGQEVAKAEEKRILQETLKAERLAFDLINNQRMLNGLMPTKWDDRLYQLSKLHTQAMSDKGELFHSPMDGPIGEDAWGGLGYSNYDYEELAQVIVYSWMSSPLHKAWILHEPLQTSVISIVISPNSQFASWTFWISEAGEGPELVQKIADEWRRETGESIPWIGWLYMKGYLEK